MPPRKGDDAAMEPFFAPLQKNVLNRQRWATREELCLEIIPWIERTYHRRRRQRRFGRLTPIEHETLDLAAPTASPPTRQVNRSRGSPHRPRRFCAGVPSVTARREASHPNPCGPSRPRRRQGGSAGRSRVPVQHPWRNY